jgi:alpha-tubulin suppressor-like RCC1 family protein
MRNIVSPPMIIQGLSNIDEISCGDEFSIAMDSNSVIYSWGSNSEGFY